MGGGKEFGFVSTSVTRIICKAKNNTLVEAQISTNSVVTDGRRFVDVQPQDNYPMSWIRVNVLE